MNCVWGPLAALALLPALLALSGCAAPQESNNAVAGEARIIAPQPSEDQQQRQRPAGRIVAGPDRITAFRPESTAVAVDAEAVDLRQVFEDLGPVATLWYQHVQTLANPFFEGRLPETRGMDLAKEYIEFYFRTYGLEPAFPVLTETPGGEVEASANRVSYRQPFTFNTIGGRMRPNVSEEQLALNGDAFAHGEDFAILGVSGSGRVTAPLSFVGYGIEEGEDGYTSFDDDTDLTGRIAVVFRYEPLDERGRSRWADHRFSAHSRMTLKLRSLTDRGAAGILLVNPPEVRDGRSGLESIGRSSRFGRVLNVPAAQVTKDLAERLLAAADPDGRDLMTWRRLADAGDIRTVHLDDSRAQITLGATVRRSGARADVHASNVAAVLPGRGDLADQWIVIGGHMDHLGDGQFGTSPQYRGQLHPGADDNASGTAGVLILAKTLSEAYGQLPADADLRSIMFIAFNAEESGLHGSRHFVNNSTVPAESITAMLNMDMIGRLRGGELSVLGFGTAAEFGDLLTPHFKASGLTVAVTGGGSGRSDDANFINAEIPALHFFTGLHPEYHAPTDRAYTMNPAGARDVLALIHDVALEFAALPDGLTFTEPQRTPGRDRGYAPVRLGIRPGMAHAGAGVLLDEVYEDTSASDAGLQRGDVILAWDGRTITALGDLFQRLQQHEPDDVVVLTVERGDDVLEIEVTLRAGAE